MRLINNQLFYDLEKYLDMKSFDELNDQINLTLAKNFQHFRPSGTEQGTLYDQNFISVYNKRAEILKTHPELSHIHALFYAKLCGTVTLGTNFIVRGTKGYPAKYSEKYLRESAILYPFDDQFKFLFDWIDAQGCFDEYGRVIFWINESGQSTTLHRDYPVGEGLNDPFIWLTGIIPKQLTILDKTTNTIHYSTSRACVFDSNNIHASKGHPQHAAWSLRIDGKFNKEWAEKAGIADHFKRTTYKND
jgi:hypothetical protein